MTDSNYPWIGCCSRGFLKKSLIVLMDALRSFCVISFFLQKKHRLYLIAFLPKKSKLWEQREHHTQLFPASDTPICFGSF